MKTTKNIYNKLGLVAALSLTASACVMTPKNDIPQSSSSRLSCKLDEAPIRLSSADLSNTKEFEWMVPSVSGRKKPGEALWRLADIFLESPNLGVPSYFIIRRDYAVAPSTLRVSAQYYRQFDKTEERTVKCNVKLNATDKANAAAVEECQNCGKATHVFRAKVNLFQVCSREYDCNASDTWTRGAQGPCEYELREMSDSMRCSSSEIRHEFYKKTNTYGNDVLVIVKDGKEYEYTRN